MARARNIKPSFFTNEIIGTLDPIIGMTFIGLWCLADKDGILEDRPLRIKAELFPYRDGLDVNGYLTVLEREKFIVRYEVDGVRYVQIVNFEKHQHPHHTEKSKGFPKPSRLERKDPLTPLNNGGTPSDSLIPDSLIPDSTPHPPINPQTRAHDPGGGVEITPGIVCKALKLAGIGRANPSNQRLIALVNAGATIGEFRSFAEKAKDKGEPFSWLLAAVEAERKRAAAVLPTLHKGPLPRDVVGPVAESFRQRDMRDSAARMSKLSPLSVDQSLLPVEQPRTIFTEGAVNVVVPAIASH